MVDNEKIPNKLVLTFNGKKSDIITGIPYKISNDKLYIDDWGGKHGSCFCFTSTNQPPENPNYLRQIFVIRETSCTGRYKILVNGNYMDSWGGNVNDAKLYMGSNDNPPEHPCYSRQIWSFYSADSKSKEFQLRNEQNNYFLDTFGRGQDSQIGFCCSCQRPTDKHYSRQLWKFTPAFDYKLNAVVDNFKYKLSSDIKRQQKKKTLHEDILDNLGSSAELVPTFNVKEELTNTYTFSFKESLKFISETKLITVIPFTGIEKEFNFKYSFEANEPITTEKKESYSIAKKVKVPPNSCIKAIDYVDFVENIEIPFEATAEITAIGDPFDYKLNAVVDNFKYKLSSDIKRQQKKKTLHEDILDNLGSSAELVPTFNVKEELTNTYTFSFKESLKFISETKLITVIPFTGIEKEFNFKYSFEANEPITTEKKESYSIAKKVKVPPNSCIKAIDYVDFVENIEIPFEATAEITAIGDRYKKNGTIIKNAKVDSDAIKLFLKENNFQGKITGSEKNSVLAKVQGTFRGSYVLRTYRKLEDINLESTVCIMVHLLELLISTILQNMGIISDKYLLSGELHVQEDTKSDFKNKEFQLQNEQNNYFLDIFGRGKDSQIELIPTFNFQEESTNPYTFSFNGSLEFISETKLITIIPFTNIEKEFDFKY
ncbi:hypothetical protein Glove_294g155 [Diversispora epigaea]|uniref:Ricin B lectin domain-containing protein n=1 Tax=Diversispora epigaea TaxID=1348612 RepID=A0A397HZF3_9GLOM|nr:hypothetical protein Glove_294g155 [Diversispora epigaea]